VVVNAPVVIAFTTVLPDVLNVAATVVPMAMLILPDVPVDSSVHVLPVVGAVEFKLIWALVADVLVSAPTVAAFEPQLTVPATDIGPSAVIDDILVDGLGRVAQSITLNGRKY
jgi:hypothetical protein